ncbi:hypothetical protein [Cytobacillus oceanisediminis]|uniref:hypothetical protein n=1 Tax=Cytobacillus oceanisediminis TaxID=665099 RepID=UPI001C234466|nr:hypothetical protein [Cytobacillus oceanisediminis]MBU8772018.1 hypothetical protein [Cytobacillus oceanisediminis]
MDIIYILQKWEMDTMIIELAETMIEGTENLLSQINRRQGNLLYSDQALKDMGSVLMEMLPFLMDFRVQNYTFVDDLTKGLLRNFITELKKIDSKDYPSPFAHHIEGLNMQIRLINK